MQPGDRSMIPARQTRYWRPTRSPLTRMIQSDAKPNRLTKYRSEPTTTRSNTAPDRASAGTSRSRDEARATNSAADLVTVMVRSLADPNNGPRGRPPADQSSPPPGQHEKAQPQRSLGITPSTAAGWPTTPRNHSFRVSSTATGRCLLTCGRLFARTPPRVSATVCNRRGAGGAATSSCQPPECHLAAKLWWAQVGSNHRLLACKQSP